MSLLQEAHSGLCLEFSVAAELSNERDGKYKRCDADGDVVDGIDGLEVSGG